MKKRRAKLGDHLIECEVSGRTLYASQAKKRWDGKWVHPDYWEPRHPSDLYRPDMTESSPAFTRPPSTDTFTNVCTLEARAGVAGYAIAGCAIAGNDIEIYEVPTGTFPSDGL